jgi:conjugative transfer pilus assembly protein TraH
MRKTLIAQALAVIMSVTPLVATSGALQSQMDSVFDSMINVTRPGVFEGQRRGVVSAGSVYVRNKIVDTNVVTFVPPSWKGGCGGIDFFGGGLFPSLTQISSFSSCEPSRLTLPAMPFSLLWTTPARSA